MNLWLDIHLSPAICPWIEANFDLSASALRDVGMARATDQQIFDHFRTDGQVIVTKDEDFVRLVRTRGMPPQVLWLRCGNTSNQRLKSVLRRALPDAVEMLKAGEPIVEIRDR